LLEPVHAEPFARGVCLQVPSALQASAVHGLLSSHEAGVQHSPPVDWMLVS
jgi:hypothetical protein